MAHKKNNKDAPKLNDLIIYPTDTVWGIGCNIYWQEGYHRILQLKEIAQPKPFSILFTSWDQFVCYLQIPEILNKSFLKLLFSKEVTINFPLTWFLLEMPSYVSLGSKGVNVRFLDNRYLNKLIAPYGDVVFTTSLNLTGGSPIFNKKSIIDFAHRSKIPLKIINSDRVKPSGMSSTILSFTIVDKKIIFKIIREGDKIKEVLDILKLL